MRRASALRGRPRHRLPQRGAGGRRDGARPGDGRRPRWPSSRPAGWSPARSAPMPSACAQAVERVRSPDGVLVLMDLGSAVMSAEMAVEMAEPGGGPILLSEAPLVEGCVAAAALAGAGASLEEVAREASGALRMKSAQLEDDEPEAEQSPPAEEDGPRDEAGPASELRLQVDNRLGLHARPAARFVGALGGLDTRGRGLQRDPRPRSGGWAQPRRPRDAGGRSGRRDRRARARLAGRARRSTPCARSRQRTSETRWRTSRPRPAPALPSRTCRSPSTTRRPSHPGPGRGFAVSPPPRASRSGPPAACGCPSPSSATIRPAHRPRSARASMRPLPRPRKSSRRCAPPSPPAAAARRPTSSAPMPCCSATPRSPRRRCGGSRRGRVPLGPGRPPRAEAAAAFRGLDDPYMRERAVDVEDVSRRVLTRLGCALSGAALQGPGIVLADELTPGEAAGLDPRDAWAIATARGGATAHAAILARALGIPAVVGLGARAHGDRGGHHAGARRRGGVRRRRPGRRGRGRAQGTAGGRRRSAACASRTRARARRPERRPPSGGLREHRQRRRRRARRRAGRGGRGAAADRVPVPRPRRAAVRGRAGRGAERDRPRDGGPPGGRPHARRGGRQAVALPAPGAGGQPVPGAPRNQALARRARSCCERSCAPSCAWPRSIL